LPKITIYTSPLCGYCHRAKQLLKKKGAEFDEVDVFMDRGKRVEMEKRSGEHTVPQIFIGKEHIGGCDELYALESKGALDLLLQG
jgi:glutaredoxin 3